MEKKVISFWLKTETINYEDVEIYQYGFSLLIKRLIHTGAILLMAAAFNELIGCSVFLFTYATLREYSGGFHAKSEKGCFFCTLIISICVITLLKIFPLFPVQVLLNIEVICGMFIWFFSPQEAINKTLEVQERIIYRKMSHKYLILFVTFSFLSINYNKIVFGITAALFLQMWMLMFGKWQIKFASLK